MKRRNGRIGPYLGAMNMKSGVCELFLTIIDPFIDESSLTLSTNNILMPFYTSHTHAGGCGPTMGDSDRASLLTFSTASKAFSTTQMMSQLKVGHVGIGWMG